MLTRTHAMLAAGATVALSCGSMTHAAGADPSRETIATVSSVDYRAVLTARRMSSGSAPTASVTLTTYTREGGRWALTRNRRLPGTYFWETVTGPRVLCRLEISTAASRQARPPRLVVQLLLSPSLGCGPPVTVALPAT